MAQTKVSVNEISFSAFPAFRAYLTSNQVVTTAGGTVALAATTEAYDRTNNLNNTTNTFTAPIAGLYLFTYHVADNSGNSSRATPIIVKNGSTSYTGQQAQGTFATGVLVLELSLAVNDTVQAKINANPANIQLIAGDANTWWTGRYVG